MRTFHPRRFKRLLPEAIGKKFGRLLVLGDGGEIKRETVWECRCDCGNVRRICASRVYRGETLSCGCLMREKTAELGRRPRKYNYSGIHAPTASSHHAMRTRCTNLNRKDSRFYVAVGGCQFLLASAVNLIAMIGERPDGTTLDRVKNDLGYCCGKCPQCQSHAWPLNVRWATPRAQAQNTRRNRNITIGGVTLCISEWARRAKIPQGTLWHRIKIGWPESELLKPSIRSPRRKSDLVL